MSTPPPDVLRYPVAPPPATPRPFGLLSVAVDGEGSPAAGPAPWERGVDYYSSNCDARVRSLDGFCPEPDIEKELTPFDPVRVEGAPFTVTSGMVCLAPNFNAEAEAEAQLARGEQFRTEVVFARQQFDRADFIRLNETPSSLLCAISQLEAYAAVHYAGTPVLHVPYSAIPELFRDQLVERDGNRLVTGWGTPVIAGAGYPQGSAGGASTPIWITGTVTVWRTEVFTNSDFNVRQNENLAIAERTYVITADCLAAMVRANICPGETPQ